MRKLEALGSHVGGAVFGLAILLLISTILILAAGARAGHPSHGAGPGLALVVLLRG